MGLGSVAKDPGRPYPGGEPGQTEKAQFAIRNSQFARLHLRTSCGRREAEGGRRESNLGPLLATRLRPGRFDLLRGEPGDGVHQ
jgi:hypothetical protein